MADTAPGATLDPEELNPDAKPKRGRGRPRKDPTDTAPRPVRPVSKASLEKEVGAFLWSISTVVSLIPPLRADALDEAEIALLAKGIADQAQRSPRFRAWVERALKVQGGSSLLVGVALIAGRRAIRHGVIPMTPEEAQMRDLQLGALIEMMAAKPGASFTPPPEPTPAPEPVERMADFAARDADLAAQMEDAAKVDPRRRAAA